MAEIGIRIVGDDQASVALRSVADTSRQTAQEISSLGGSWGDMSNVIAAGVVKGQAAISLFKSMMASVSGVTEGVRNYLNASNDMNQSWEMSKNSFAVLLGSMEKGTALLEQMKKEAASTVFSFDDFKNASRALLAYQFPAEQVISLTKDIGAAVYALGAQKNDGMDRIIRALGQMKSSGRVAMEELNQLSDVGVPAVKMLADTFGVSTAEMRKMVHDGIVPVDQAVYGLVNQFEKLYGGNVQKLGNSFEVMSSNFQDFTQRAQLAIGSGIFETNKQRLQELTSIVQSPVFLKVAEQLGGVLGNAYKKFHDQAVSPALQAVTQFLNTLDMANPHPAIEKLLGNLEGIMGGLISQYFGGSGIAAVRNFMAVLNQLAAGVDSVLKGGDIYAVFDRISKIGQNTGAGQFISTLVQELANLQTSFMQLKNFALPIFQEVMNGLSGMANSGSVRDIKNSFTDLFSITSNDGRTFQLKFGEIVAYINTAVQKLSNFLSPLGASLRDIFQSIVSPSSALFRDVASGISGFLNSVEGAKSPIIDGLTQIVSSLSNLGHGIATAIRTGDTQQLMTSITDGLKPLWTWIDTWGARALDLLMNSMGRLFSGDFNDSAFLAKINETSQKAIQFISQISMAITDSFGDKLFPLLSPRLQAIGSWLTTQWGIVINGLGNFMNERLPTAIQVALNTTSASFSNFFDKLAVEARQGFIEKVMPNLAGSQWFSDMQAKDNVALQQRMQERNQIASQNNNQLIQQLQQMPEFSTYFQGLGDLSPLVAQFRAFQQQGAPEALKAASNVAGNIATGFSNSMPQVQQSISSDTQSSLTNSANALANSPAVTSAWERVGRNIASSISNGYSSGYAAFADNLQTTLGIPQIMQQMQSNVQEISNLSQKVYALQVTTGTAPKSSFRGGAGVGDERSLPPKRNGITPPSGGNDAKNQTATNGNRTSNVNITINTPKPDNTLISTAQYLAIRDSFIRR